MQLSNRRVVILIIARGLTKSCGVKKKRFRLQSSPAEKRVVPPAKPNVRIGQSESLGCCLVNKLCACPNMGLSREYHYKQSHSLQRVVLRQPVSSFVIGWRTADMILVPSSSSCKHSPVTCCLTSHFVFINANLLLMLS